MLAKYTHRHCPHCLYTLDCPCNGVILLLAYVQLHKCVHVSSIAACCLVMSWLIDEKGNKPRRARFRSFNFNHSQLVGYCFRVHISLPCLLFVSSNLFTFWAALHPCLVIIHDAIPSQVWVCDRITRPPTTLRLCCCRPPAVSGDPCHLAWLAVHRGP